MNKIRLGISRCLLGDNVRYDGSHKKDQFLVNTLSQYADYVPVCPEVECGMSVPRESMRLVGDPACPKLIGNTTASDYTEKMLRWAERRVKELESEELYGFIFKSNSPSSGMERVKVYDDKGMPRKVGVGIFARMFMAHFPRLPVEDEGRLNDPDLRENFIERIFTLGRWRETLSEKTMASLIRFHTIHKLLIMAHSPSHYRQMGKLVAEGKKTRINDLFDQYEGLLTDALKLKCTIKKHVNVLQHIMGYFKKHLSSDEKQELAEVIEQYHNNYLPLIVPITLLNHYVRKYQEPYLQEQVYLHPHPMELKLRNHV